MTRPTKEKALELLNKQLDYAECLDRESLASPSFQNWWRTNESIVRNLFGVDSPQLRKLATITWKPRIITPDTTDAHWKNCFESGLMHANSQLLAFVREIENFWSDAEDEPKQSAKDQIIVLLSRFDYVVRQLRGRHADRPPLDVADEYDVQDLLHALLRIYFDDIRTEEWCPSYAGSSARMDFLLPDAEIVIECKKSRTGMTAKTVGEELIVDITKYRTHPNVKRLICFIYDPPGLIKNPRGLERDLTKNSEGLDVVCFICPKL